MIINSTSSCWSSTPIRLAIENIVNGTFEPIFGKLSYENIQLCPQHSDYIDEKLLYELLEKYPFVKFRLHSDVKLINKKGITLDLIDLDNDNLWYFEKLNYFSNILKSSVYSLHAGKRVDSLNMLLEKYKILNDIFDCDIAVEGHYPCYNDKFLISNWKEYNWLLQNNLNYVIDLSHLNIVAKREGWNYELVKELLKSSLCKEIHVSFNEGTKDNHLIAENNFMYLWNNWKKLIEENNFHSDIFSEGNQVLHTRIQFKRITNHD